MNTDETSKKGSLHGLHILTSISKSISAVDQTELWRVWNDGRNIEKERVLRKVKTKSDIITEVVPIISQFLNYDFPRLYVPEDLDKNKVITELYKAILGSYPDVDVTRDTRKINFDAMTLLSVNQVVNSAYPIFDEMFTLTQHYGLVLFEDEASEISGLTISIFILMIYLNRIVSTEIYGYNKTTLARFLEPFRTAINEDIQKALGYFGDDNEKKCKFLAIIKYLFSRISGEGLPNFPSIIELYIDKIITDNRCGVFTKDNYVEAIASYYSDKNKSIIIDINTLIDSLSNTDPTQDLRNATVIGLTARRVLELESAPYLGEYDKQKIHEKKVDEMILRGKERRNSIFDANRKINSHQETNLFGYLTTGNRHDSSNVKMTGHDIAKDASVLMNFSNSDSKNDDSKNDDSKDDDSIVYDDDSKLYHSNMDDSDSKDDDSIVYDDDSKLYHSNMDDSKDDDNKMKEKGGTRTEKKYPRHGRRMQRRTKKMKKQSKTIKKHKNNRRKTRKYKKH
jgi:hypothetical protein